LISITPIVLNELMSSKNLKYMNINEFVKKFAEQFDNTPESIFKPETRFRDLEEWDSMIALAVMAMTDEQYDVRITPDEMTNSQTIDELYNIIASKSNG
jgi:acyl carrier protein